MNDIAHYTVVKWHLCLCALIASGCEFPALPAIGVDATATVGSDATDAGPTQLALLAGNGFSSDSSLRLYTPNTTDLLASSWTSPESFPVASIAWADFDGDTDLDFAVGTDGRDRVYKNTGGAFALAWTAQAETFTREIRWADIDGDGDLDLVASGTGGLWAHLNDAGSLAELSRTLIDVGSTNQIDAFDLLDVDDDSDLDIATAGNMGKAVYANNGVGGFGSAIWSEAQRSWKVKWGKNRDLLFGSIGVSVYRWVSGRPMLAFQSSDLQPPLGDFIGDVGWIDYDSDGDLDVAAIFTQTNIRVLRNTGSTFEVGWIAPDDFGGAAVSIADYDGDGRPDMALARSGFANLIYRNVGGTFAEVWTAPSVESTRAIGWGRL